MLRTVTLSLFLAAVLAPLRAAAEPTPGPDEPASTRVEALTFLGTSYCFPWAPAEARCDVRLPRDRSDGLVVPFAGLRLCVGEVPEATRCDLRVEPQEAQHHHASL